MCLITTVHFADLEHEDVRPRIATQPFSVSGEGDFFDVLATESCHCANKSGSSLTTGLERWFEQLEDCELHDCCITYRQLDPCSWYTEQQTTNVQFSVDEPEPERCCPNQLMVHEYIPIEVLGSGMDYWPWPHVGLPVFPSVEMFYSREQLEQNREWGIDLTAELDMVRNLASLAAQRLWKDKRELQMAISFASFEMGRFEAQFARDGTFSRTATNLISHYHLQVLRLIEQSVVQHYGLFLENLGRALTLVGKYPNPGETYVAPRGVFSISYQQLKEVELDEESQLEMWDGPLKYSAKLEERYRRLRAAAAAAAQQRPTNRKRPGEGDAGPSRKRRRL